MTKRKYDFPLQIGDKVQMGEMIGQVTEIDCNESEPYPVGIKLEGSNDRLFVTSRGLYSTRQLKPCLIIIDRPRKKVKKTLDLWVNIYEWGTETCETKEEAEECACEDAIATKVHMTGEYWVEE